MLYLIERVGSRELSGGSKTFHYRLTGTSDDVLAKTTLLASTPTTYDGLVREQDPTIDPIWVDTDSGDGEWECTVRYNPPETTESEIGAVAITGSTLGGTQHITQSLSTAGAYAKPGEVAPNYFGAIGVTADNVQGVDIVVPVFNYTVRKVFNTAGTPSPPSLAAMYALTGFANDATFAVRDTRTGQTISVGPGECLFRGGEFGDQRTDGGIEFAFHFSASPNKAGISIGEIFGINKQGWEYLWVRYDDAEDEAAKAVVKRARAAYVERVCEEGDFGALAVGI